MLFFLLVFGVLAAAELPVPLGLDPYMQIPKNSPLTKEAVLLGRRLFRDKALSRDGTVSCASCHDAAISFTDGKPLAVGIDDLRGTRNSPTLINRGYGASFFWDGRTPTLEQLALEPIFNVIEMDTPLDQIVPKLRKAGYPRDIQNADVARAIAAYLRTIRSGNSRYDRHINGDRIYTKEEQLGLDLFSSKAHCWSCHTGNNFTDEQFHNTGIAWKNAKLTDPGRGRTGAFKTPTLRDLSRTAPYMHDGSLPTLEAVIDYYDRGANPNPHLDPALQPLHLTPEEKRALKAFLLTLTGDVTEGWPQ